MDSLFSIQKQVSQQLQRAVQKDSESTRRVVSFISGIDAGGFLTESTFSVVAAGNPPPEMVNELHRLAALTYNHSENKRAFLKIRGVIENPENQTPASILRALILIKHLVIYGCEQSVDNAWELGPFIEKLTAYNTALGRGIIHKIQGGGVDKGFSMRQFAAELVNILRDSDKIRNLRRQNADPNSLVPVLDIPKPAKMCQAQPALAFGGGYSSEFGKKETTVVGAKHSLEEMIKLAEKEKAAPVKFFDDREKEEDELRRKNMEPPQRSLDSAYTRQILAPDLLDLSYEKDMVQSHNFPKAVEDLAAKKREDELQKQIVELQLQLDASKGTPETSVVMVARPKNAVSAISSMDNLGLNFESGRVTAPATMPPVPSTFDPMPPVPPTFDPKPPNMGGQIMVDQAPMGWNQGNMIGSGVGGLMPMYSNNNLQQQQMGALMHQAGDNSPYPDANQTVFNQNLTNNNNNNVMNMRNFGMSQNSMAQGNMQMSMMPENVTQYMNPGQRHNMKMKMNKQQNNQGGNISGW